MVVSVSAPTRAGPSYTPTRMGHRPQTGGGRTYRSGPQGSASIPSQDQLAELAGIDRKSGARLEGGSSDARLTVWSRLARVVGVPPADLVRE
ncbi:helix-turn-helix transcriptional regulator [Streptomyces sp. NPDC059382]|uniref:helix-turn-helix transcriptional regulator n=1 Tax=Streptomyces sp. NPDC059382 TaxID=3346816 RepID=UPI0036B049E1